MFSIDDYDYALPQNLIAQFPAEQKDTSRLLRLNRRAGEVSHHLFRDLETFLSPGDVVVTNNTKVVPARIIGKKMTGGAVEALILDYPGIKEKSGTVCQCLIKASKKLLPGMRLVFEGAWPAEVVDGENGIYRICFTHDFEIDGFLRMKGRVPLPPYIHRNNQAPPCDDDVCYQTVYAAEKGAVAAPTAGLHFTLELIQKLKDKGVSVVPLTLHVGYGTFMPVRVQDIRRHQIHRERFSLSEDTARTVNQARASGGRIVAVGTTAVRVLEYLHFNNGKVTACAGECDLFIYPGFSFGVVDAMITNFHLPRSTLLMLVSAFAGREQILETYRAAINEKYRFYSYGDAMFIE